MRTRDKIYLPPQWAYRVIGCNGSSVVEKVSDMAQGRDSPSLSWVWTRQPKDTSMS